MKYTFHTLLTATSIVLLSTSCNNHSGEPVITIDSVVKKDAPADWLTSDSLSYNAELATKLGADEYGMKQYVMAYLKRGPKRDQDSATAAELQKAHLENINRMAEEGKLIVAGPFMDDGDVRGIYVFNVATVEEAKALTETDPAIKAGRLEMELHPWYGSAALMLNPKLHKLFEKKNVAE
ncbi:MAG: YciI family protein [Bacteroidia bacterium]|nr:YciI family protein [Bacteroidia bacterium]